MDVKQIVNQMTLEEKAAMCSGADLDTDDEQRVEKMFADFIQK